jgi:hypothetical protein
LPLLKKGLGQTRIDFAKALTPGEIEDLAGDPDIRVLQCSSPVETPTWDLLNQKFFSRRPEVELRVYGFYSSICDLSFLARLPNVRRFAADSLMSAIGIEHLRTLDQLEKLSIGIHSLDSFDFLQTIPTGITTLTLSATKSKKPRLDHLARFQSLNKLFIEGHQQGIDAIAELHALEGLTLRSISTPNIEYVATLPRLWSLDIKLGGITDLSAIQGKESIKYLELWQVRALSDIGVISSLTGLQFLSLQDLQNVRAIPDLSMLAKLRRIYLENMKGLEDVSALRHAPALEEFIHVSAQNISPEKYKDLAHHPVLRELSVGFGSREKNQEFDDWMALSGIGKYQISEFVFQ